MPDMITRCPNCATAFRISDTLLTSAKGRVRCGSCLQVFNAKEHLQSAPRPAAAKPTPRSPASIAPNSVPMSITGFLKRQDGAQDAEAASAPWRAEHRPASEQLDQSANSLFERPTAAKVPVTEAEDLEPEDDEAWVLELLKDDSDSHVQFKKIAPKQEESPSAEIETEQLAGSAAESDLEMDILPEDAELPDNNEDLSLDLDELLAELEVETEPAQEEPVKPFALETDRETPPRQPLATAVDVEQTPSAIADSTAGVATAYEHEHTRASANAVSGAAHHKSKSNVSLQDTIAAIEPEPLEVDWSPSPNWKKRLMWPALALLALLLLLAQVAWLEFHRLNTVEPYRSFYALVCRHIECTLPELVDRRQISTSNLVVRSHPEADNALLVDVILQNNADFEQTFPTLLLTFSDLHNQPVASRRLAPSDYLGGELAGRDNMPVKQPIHIGLEIVDPGPEAVSYSIAIVD